MRVTHGFVYAAAVAGVALAGCSLFTDLSGFSEPANELDARAPAPEADAAPDAAPDAADGAASDGGSAYVAAVLADGPIAYYPLDDASGTSARDVVGGKNGAWVGKSALAVQGAVGTGALFDGATTRLEMPAGSFGFTGKVPYTIELWLSVSAVGTAVRFLLDYAAGADDSAGYRIYFNNDFFLCSRADAAGADGYGSITPIAPSAFVHLAMTYDGAQVHLYANGSSNGPANGNRALPSIANGRLVFGDSAGGQFFKLAGVLDEIAIYDKALPAARVAAHYAARAP